MRYEVLKKLYEKSPLYLEDIEPEKLRDFKAVARQLGIEGYVRCPVSGGGPYSLTVKGRALYLELKEAKEKADNLESSAKEAERVDVDVPSAEKVRNDKLEKVAEVVGIVSAILGILGFFMGLFTM